MKRVMFCLFTAIIVLSFGTTVKADLFLRGTDTMGNRLIYDDDFDITWYDYTAPLDTWQNQEKWASGLSVDYGGNTYSDWRLPATVNNRALDYGYDGTTAEGYNIKSSEMGHLYYTELGNIGYFNTSGIGPQVGWGLRETGDFLNFPPTVLIYWSSTEIAQLSGWYFTFNFHFGSQFRGDPSDQEWYGMAVRDGDVPDVP